MTHVNFKLLGAVKWLKELMNEKAVSAGRQAQILEAIKVGAAIVVAGSAKEGGLVAALRVITDEVGRGYETVVNLIAAHVAEKIAGGKEQEVPATGKTLACHVAKEINPDYRVQTESLCFENPTHEGASEREPVYALDDNWHHGTHLQITQNGVNHLRDECMRVNGFSDTAAQNRAILSIVRVAIVVLNARATGIDAGKIYKSIEKKLETAAPALDKSAPLLATFAELYLNVSKRNKWPRLWSVLSDNKRTILSFILAFGDAGEIDHLLTLREEVAYEVIHLLGNQCRCWLKRPIARLPSLSRAMSKSKHLNKVANGLANQAIDNAKQLQLFAGA